MAERPPPDPAALLAVWMEWERGDAGPADLVRDLKRAGLRELLEEAAGAGQAADTPPA